MTMILVNNIIGWKNKRTGHALFTIGKPWYHQYETTNKTETHEQNIMCNG